MPEQSYFAWQLLKTAWLPTTQDLVSQSPSVFVPCQTVRDVAGELANYVAVPDEWDEEEFVEKGRNLFRFLGLREEVDLNAARHLISNAQRYPVENSLRDHLGRLYRHAGWILSATDHDHQQFGNVPLLTTGDDFKLARILIWDDDPAIGRYFSGSKDHDFAWIPRGVERYYLEAFFKAARVQPLSTAVQRKLINGDEATCDEDSTSLFRDRARHLWSIFVHYQAARASQAKQQLRNVTVLLAPEVNVLLRLGGTEVSAQCPVFFDDTASDLYQIASATDFEIASELCRVFGLSFDHVSDVEAVIRRGSIAETQNRFQQQGIALLDWEQQSLGHLGETTGGEKSDEAKEAAGRAGIEDDFAGATRTARTYQSAGSSRRRQHTGKSVERTSLPYEQRMQIEASNIERIIASEAKEGRTATDVSKEFRGYDIESVDDNEQRHIELKTRSYAYLTDREYRTAQDEGMIYWLYVVVGEEVYRIQDPAGKCGAIEIETLESRWKIENWQENADITTL